MPPVVLGGQVGLTRENRSVLVSGPRIAGGWGPPQGARPRPYMPAHRIQNSVMKGDDDGRHIYTLRMGPGDLATSGPGA